MKPIKKGDRLYRVCADGPNDEHRSVESRVIQSVKAFEDTAYVEIRIDSPFSKMSEHACAFDQSMIDTQVFRSAREAVCAFDRDRERDELSLARQLGRVREARCWATAQLDAIDTRDGAPT